MKFERMKYTLNITLCIVIRIVFQFSTLIATILVSFKVRLILDGKLLKLEDIWNLIPNRYKQNEWKWSLITQGVSLSLITSLTKIKGASHTWNRIFLYSSMQHCCFFKSFYFRAKGRK